MPLQDMWPLNLPELGGFGVACVAQGTGKQMLPPDQSAPPISHGARLANVFQKWEPAGIMQSQRADKRLRMV
jgi:hypothetical protein